MEWPAALSIPWPLNAWQRNEYGYQQPDSPRLFSVLAPQILNLDHSYFMINLMITSLSLFICTWIHVSQLVFQTCLCGTFPWMIPDHVRRLGTHFTISLSADKSKYLKCFTFLLFLIMVKWSYQIKNLHMSSQRSCPDITKIVAISDIFSVTHIMSAFKIRFGLWAHKMLMKCVAEIW